MNKEEKTKLEKLIAFVSYYANCPCCGENEVCVSEWTFKEDAPNEYDIIQYAREAMK